MGLGAGLRLRGERVRSRRARRHGRLLLVLALSCLPFLPVPKDPCVSSALAISEAGFDRTFEEEVWPYYRSGELGFFQGTDGILISWARYETANEAGALVILPGKSESYLKYAELIYDLRVSGYSLYLMDHRGMGFSGRLLTKDPDKVHVEDFNDYVLDLKAFIDGVVGARPHARRVILAHSLGGTVALRFLEEFPGVFQGAIFSAPMLTIDTEPLPEKAAYLLSASASFLGLGRRYCPGYGPWKLEPFEGNELTGSACRYSLWQERMIASHPEARSGGPTHRWLRESLPATWEAVRQAGRVRMPVLLLQAGRDDIVKPQGQDSACRRMPRCRMRIFPDARHEILMERDPIRDEALAMILGFLREVAAD